MPVRQPRPSRDNTSEQLIDARAEAQRRIERREARAKSLRRVAELDEQIAQIDQLVAKGIAVEALAAERVRLLEEHTTLSIEIHATSITAWSTALETVRARDGEGINETTWRVLIDRGATGYQIAALVDDSKDSALRKRMDRWRAELRRELERYRAELLAQPFPWRRTHELLAAVEGMLERLG
jgi:hypothetical protein